MQRQDKTYWKLERNFEATSKEMTKNMWLATAGHVVKILYCAVEKAIKMRDEILYYAIDSRIGRVSKSRATVLSTVNRQPFHVYGIQPFLLGLLVN